MRDFCNGAKHLVVWVTLLGGGSVAVLLPAPAAPPQGRDASEIPGRTRALSGAAPDVRPFIAPPREPGESAPIGQSRAGIGFGPAARQFSAQATRPAVSEATSQTAGPAAPTCARCHDSQLAARNAGGHKAIDCETCHGPQAKHAASDGKEKPAKPNVIPLCLNCHEKDPAKPAGRPQIDKAEHYNGTTCSDCHLPHAPKM